LKNRYATLLAGSFSGTEIAIDMSSLRFLKPDVVIVDGSMDLTGLHAADGSPKTAKALFIAIMTNDHGQWKFTTFWSKRQ
jgi:hypothetical protein